MPQPQWYVAVLVFRGIVINDSSDTPLLDHQVRVLRAIDPESAYLGALSLGGQAEHSYRNAQGELITWEFLGLKELSQLGDVDIGDGTEVYSWLSRADPSASVTSKDDLDVFLARANRDRTAGELLDD